jgi:hypothetical protein
MGAEFVVADDRQSGGWNYGESPSQKQKSAYKK